MKYILKFCLLGALLFCHSSHANDERWFEIEMLIFRQSPNSTIKENFDNTLKVIKPGRAYDLITPYYKQDISSLLNQLTLCPVQTPFNAQASIAIHPVLINMICIFEKQPHAWQEENLFQAPYVISHVAFPDTLASTLTSEALSSQSPHLAPASALQLHAIASNIRRQKDMELLLHTSFRQTAVSERRAISSRWFAGKNFTEQFHYDGTIKHGENQELTVTNEEHEAQLLNKINRLLADLNSNKGLAKPSNTENKKLLSEKELQGAPNEVWQLDGLFKLHLDHYLFVNTEFNLRETQNEGLNSIYIKQSRRVISGEIHYLDHPKLGIVIQIRRYEPPSVEEVTEKLN